MDSSKPNPQSMRVLIRPPIPPSHSQTPPALPSHAQAPAPSPHPLPSTSSEAPATSPSPLNPQSGVVVVGFIGKRHDDVAYLMNRIIDSNVFGSGGLDKPIFVNEPDEKTDFAVTDDMKSWFEFRNISYHHDEEKGILFLQFSSTRCPLMEGNLESKMGFDSLLEDYEYGDLQAMLFMFSNATQPCLAMQVCHVVVFIQEGPRFDTQILKKLRVLQAAKQAMTPFVKSQSLPLSVSGSPFASPSRRAASGRSSDNPSPVKSRGIFNRNNSAITLMSGLGSYTSLLPGQCTPVTLFVFLDDFADDYPSSSVEEPADISSANQSSSVGASARPSVAPKVSGSVVVLARPMSKSEGGFRKKLQFSLEAQIRFSIKKCRTLSGSETGHTGSRSGGVSNSAMLFSLDASKAVALLDVTSNKRGESLEFATCLVEDVLNGKATSDSLLFESHSQSANREDLLSIKEFICRQTDILRGRGGVVSNTNSGPASGVGMVAVAAAAAAASAASGKTFTSPELPHLEKWLSSSQLILQAILSAKYAIADETEISKRRQRNSVSPPLEGNASKVSDPLEIAMSNLASGRGINTRFSTLWCQKALPVAKETYLNELPPCYPTSQHKAHLERALHAFNSMVKGPAVQFYLQKLEEECTSIWTSGRQLCDAVSLTGKPCMHQRHDVDTGGLCSSDEIKIHSSGYVFLHACACGRSRLLRPDPFDFETANATFNRSMDCDKLLPTVQLPQGSDTSGPIHSPSWSLIRVGNARYYQPSKGLMQSGFSSTQKFLLRWTILLERPKYENDLLSSNSEQANINRFSSKARDEPNTDSGIEKAGDLSMQNGHQIQKKSSAGNIKTDDKVNNLGKGVSNFNMRKAFSEVVAGSTAANSGFPPLQSNRQIISNSEKIIKPKNAREGGREKVNGISDEQVSEKVALIPAIHEVKNDSTIVSNDVAKGNQIFQIGTHLDSMKMNRIEKTRPVTSSKHATVYIGFEHECPRGHRFILTADHLNRLGSPYALPVESAVPSSLENIDHKGVGPSRGGKNGGHGKGRRLANGMISTSSRKLRNLEKSNEGSDDGISNIEGPAQFSRHPVHAAPGKDLETGLQPLNLNESGYGTSLLDRSLPIYMNCPHCLELKSKNDQTDVRFAGTISQLQRIFLVTPHFPIILAANPVIQFEESCLPPSVPDRKKKLQFCLGCQVILPPESFLSLRLPFIYGVQLENGNLHPLMPFEQQPELTAWITKGTTLQFVTKDSIHEELFI
ncbi:hypothetical protein H5410_034201 [Solanum commersonii]|uniref:Nonsense-mediated mRNA decay factor SMG8 n=1 Tax=Solanum commersonii TaxID=4109 RepID=A0A9J5YSR2_SOLCO|nr:hypothetical protein H5410_034201 [Solanum commersonii]